MAEGHYTQTATQMPVLNEFLSSGRPRKLRESCTQCASAKVKCNKVKPTCGRCVRRGLTCEYGISRRTGRNRAPSAVSVDSMRPSLDLGLPTPGRSPQPSNPPSTATGYFAHSRNTSSSDSLTVYSVGNPYSRSHTPQCMPPSPPLNTPAIITPLGTPRSTFAPVPQLEVDYWHTMEAGVDDLLANMSSPNFPTVEATLNPNLSLVNLPHGPFMEFSLPMSDPVEDGLMNGSSGDHSSFDFNALAPSLSSTSPSSHSSVSSHGCIENTRNNDIFFTNTTGCCMVAALSMMSRLFPNAGMACTMPGVDKLEDSCRMRTVESVIAENKEVIESLTPLLDCPCAQDEYILSIVALTIFKVLGSYAAASEVEGWQQQLNTSANTLMEWNAGMNTPSLLAGQLVLNELQNVHKLVNTLSLRLESIRLQNSRLYNSSSESNKSSMPRSSTLSVPMFEQLEQDLRNRLKAVSSRIIEQMRHT